MLDSSSNMYVVTPDQMEGGRLDFVAHHPSLHWVREYRRAPSRVPLGSLIEEPVYGLGESTSTEGNTPYLTVQHILTTGQISPTPAMFVDDAPDDALLTAGDILIARTGFSLGKAAVVTDEYEGYAFGSFCLRLRVRADARYSAEFLVRFINSDAGQAQIRLLRAGSDKPNINTDHVKSIRIPVVPEDEQEGIVRQAKVWEDGAVRAATKAEAAFEAAEVQLLTRIGVHLPPRRPPTFFFQKAKESASLSFVIAASELGSRWQYLYNDPRNAVPTQIGAIRLVPLSSVVDGAVRRGVQPDVDEAGTVKVFKTVDVKNRSLDYAHALTVSQEFWDDNRPAHVRRNDVIVSATGYGSMGKVDVYGIDDPALISGELLAFTLQPGYDPHFVCHWLRSPAGQMQFDRLFSGTSGQTHLYEGDLGQFLVPNSDPTTGIALDRQRVIAAEVDTALAAVDLHERKATRRWERGRYLFRKLVDPYE